MMGRHAKPAEVRGEGLGCRADARAATRNCGTATLPQFAAPDTSPKVTPPGELAGSLDTRVEGGSPGVAGPSGALGRLLVRPDLTQALRIHHVGD
jgi:hypothetical protein